MNETIGLFLSRQAQKAKVLVYLTSNCPWSIANARAGCITPALIVRRAMKANDLLLPGMASSKEEVLRAVEAAQLTLLNALKDAEFIK